MSAIIHILCEGQTEDAFVKRVLKPFLKQSGIVVRSTILMTNKAKNAMGGSVSFNQIEQDLASTMNSVRKQSGYDTHYYTMMVDFYALPADFPQFDGAMAEPDRYQAVALLEQAMKTSLSFCPQFIPYIQLHEFEALVFCGLDFLKQEYPNCAKDIDDLSAVLAVHQGNPELVNNDPKTAPSKRIIQALGKKYKYNKPQSGTNVTSAVGMDQLMDCCPHFREWVEKLLQCK